MTHGPATMSESGFKAYRRLSLLAHGAVQHGQCLLVQTGDTGIEASADGRVAHSFLAHEVGAPSFAFF